MGKLEFQWQCVAVNLLHSSVLPKITSAFRCKLVCKLHLSIIHYSLLSCELVSSIWRNPAVLHTLVHSTLVQSILVYECSGSGKHAADCQIEKEWEEVGRGN